MTKIIIANLVFFFLWSCKSDQSKTTQLAEAEQIEIAEDFLTFYEQFHMDSIFQIEHISFPLAGEPSEVGQGFKLEGPFTWKKEYWRLHKPFNDMGGSFDRRYESFAGIITEIIEDDSHQFKMIRRFSKIDNQWMLIYYKEMGL